MLSNIELEPGTIAENPNQFVTTDSAEHTATVDTAVAPATVVDRTSGGLDHRAFTRDEEKARHFSSFLVFHFTLCYCCDKPFTLLQK